MIYKSTTNTMPPPPTTTTKTSSSQSKNAVNQTYRQTDIQTAGLAASQPASHSLWKHIGQEVYKRNNQQPWFNIIRVFLLVFYIKKNIFFLSFNRRIKLVLQVLISCCNRNIYNLFLVFFLILSIVKNYD